MRIIFVGGVHGVGKTTMCSAIAQELGGVYWTASGLIKEEKASAIASDGKLVKDIDGNQDILVRAFRRKAVGCESSFIILDGHFALRDANRVIQKVPLNVFALLEVSAAVRVHDEPGAIALRMSNRDGTVVCSSDVAELQEVEAQHAQYVADALGFKIHCVPAFDLDTLRDVVHAIVQH